jgi:hypothetical protein
MISLIVVGPDYPGKKGAHVKVKYQPRFVASLCTKSIVLQFFVAKKKGLRPLAPSKSATKL